MMRSRSSILARVLLFLLPLIFIAASLWQVKRAEYKEALQTSLQQKIQAPVVTVSSELLDAEQTNLRQVKASGRWLPDRTILLDNKVHNEEVGYEVITPLSLGNNRVVLVDRGWIKAPPLRSEMPVVIMPTQEVDVHGVARVPTGRFLELGSQQITGKVWQNLTIERYRDWSKLDLQPFVIYQTDAPVDGLVRVSPMPEASPISASRHYGYAAMWMGLAAMTMFMTLLARRKSKTT